MSLLNFILDLVGLLLWVNWRAMGFKEYVPYRSTLVHTLKSAAPRRPGRWRYLAGLGLLLWIRSWIYRPLGSGLDWVPHLNLQVVSIPFRSDLPWRMTLFSVLSFVLTLVIFHLWLLLFSIANRAIPDSQPLQRLVRLQLGWADRLPWPVKLSLPIVGAMALWTALHPILVALRMLPTGDTARLIVEQGAVFGLVGLLTWKYLVVGVLIFHLLNSYVHLGHSPVWEFGSLTARQLLKPLRWLPLEVGRVDFAPTLGVLLTLLLAEFAGRGLVELFRQLPL